ncbi:MAG: hypothetical protein ACP5KK_03090 [Candidatus Nanoarchaeia archaeon]
MSTKIGNAAGLVFTLVVCIIIALVAYRILIQFFAAEPMEKALKELEETIEEVCSKDGTNKTINLYIPPGNQITLTRDGYLKTGKQMVKLDCPDNVKFWECATAQTFEGKEELTINVTKELISSIYKIKLATNASCTE